MAGVTDGVFRRLVREIGGAGLVSMEFVSSEALTRGVRSAVSQMAFTQQERPIAIQIYGSDARRMADAAASVERAGADVCDINMGCPANKILKGCAGAALMGNLPLARAIVGAVRSAITIPLTVKFRTGIDEPRANWIELGRICEGEGVAAVSLHARTARQMFAGRAEWDRIARLKEAVGIPVIGNGDVENAGDAVAMMRQTGCDAVMIGRAALKNPWIFAQAAALLEGRPPASVSIAQRRDLIRRHFALAMACGDDKLVLHKMKSFTGWYTHGLPSGRLLRWRIGEIRSPQEFLEAVEGYFARAGS